MSTFNEYNDYCDHIERIMQGRNEDGCFKYKTRVLREMESRTKQVLKRGLSDKNVAHDLVKDEFSEKHVLDSYNEFLAVEKEKKIASRLPLASLLMMLASVVIYLAIGFVAGIWHPTWLIIEGCATAVLINVMFFGITWLDRRKKFYIVMRLIVMGAVMVISQFVFLVLRIPMHIEKAYLVFLASLAMMFIGDLILATATKQKLLIFNYLVTIPVVTVFVYVILGLLHIIPWSWGAEIILFAVIADLIVLWAYIRHNRKYIYKPEVNEEW